MIKVSDYVIQRLEATGAGHMFMLPGGGAMPLNGMIWYHMERALYEACHRRKGPVWLDIPLDVQAAVVDEEKLIGYVPAEPVKSASVEKQELRIIDEVNHVKKPVLLAGNGIRLSGAVHKLAEKVQAVLAGEDPVEIGRASCRERV